MALVPDVIDEDEVRTQTRKDGAYFGMISLLRKLSRSLAIGLSGVALGYFGYASGVPDQSPEAIRGIRTMFCVVPAIACTISALLLLRFPIDRNRHRKIQRALRERYTTTGRLQV